MYLAKVIGTVVSTQKIKELSGVKLLIVQPLDEDENDMGEPIVAIDTVMAGPKDTVFYVTGREASMALEEKKMFTPVDSAIIGIVEGVRS
jgi:ethanolamine utilization protein EutN